MCLCMSGGTWDGGGGGWGWGRRDPWVGITIIALQSSSWIEGCVSLLPLHRHLPSWLVIFIIKSKNQNMQNTSHCSTYFIRIRGTYLLNAFCDKKTVVPIAIPTQISSVLYPSLSIIYLSIWVMRGKTSFIIDLIFPENLEFEIICISTVAQQFLIPSINSNGKLSVHFPSDL